MTTKETTLSAAEQAAEEYLKYAWLDTKYNRTRLSRSPLQNNNRRENHDRKER